MTKVSIEQLQQAPWYFRDDLGDDLEELGTSLAEQQEEPILIAPQQEGTYMVVDGWRRIAAARSKGVTELEARLYDGDDPLLTALVMARFDKSHDEFQLGAGVHEWLECKLQHVVPGDHLFKKHGRKRLPDPVQFVRGYDEKDAWKELNEAMGDPLGLLERRLAPLGSIGNYLRAYVKSSQGVKEQVRQGKITPRTGRQIAFSLTSRPDLQDKVAEKAAKEELGKTAVTAGCKVLNVAKGDERLEQAVLETDWSLPEEKIKETAKVLNAVTRKAPDKDFRTTPAVKELLDAIATFADWVYTGAKMVKIGKISPEARRFIADKVAKLIERLESWRQELLGIQA